jgi:hypothetical protein
MVMPPKFKKISKAEMDKKVKPKKKIKFIKKKRNLMDYKSSADMGHATDATTELYFRKFKSTSSLIKKKSDKAEFGGRIQGGKVMDYHSKFKGEFNQYLNDNKRDIDLHRKRLANASTTHQGVITGGSAVNRFRMAREYGN